MSGKCNREIGRSVLRVSVGFPASVADAADDAGRDSSGVSVEEASRARSGTGGGLPEPEPGPGSEV